MCFLNYLTSFAFTYMCKPVSNSKYKLTYITWSFVFSPYDGKWSKTMVGFGPEDDHFVAELTYNYGVGEYRIGNDFLVG